MPTDIPLKCRCGALRGLITDVVPRQGNRSICLCDDCQAYAHFLGRADDVLDANGGTDIIPVAPSKLKITQGHEHLKCLRLIPTGMLRWYAGCCQSPIANSMPSPKLPFAGLVRTIIDLDPKSLDERLGPVQSRVQGRFGKGTLPAGTSPKAPIGLILRTIRFLLAGWIQGNASPSPFFDRTGKPVVEPYVLTPAEREALRPLCGPDAAR